MQLFTSFRLLYSTWFSKKISRSQTYRFKNIDNTRTRPVSLGS